MSVFSGISPARERRIGRIVGWTLSVFLIAALAAAMWVTFRGIAAAQHLQAARAQISNAAEAMTDPDAAAVAIRELAEDARAARELTSDPIWRASSQLPWAGPQLSAVSTIAETLDDISTSTLTPLAQVLSSVDLDSFRFTNGGIDLSAFTSIRTAADQAATGMASASEALKSIDTSPLVRPLREIVDTAVIQVDNASSAASTLQRTAELLPTMLGSDEKRTWLLLFQNPAELRSLGGMPGATAVVTAEHGNVSLVEQGTAGIRRYASPVTELDPDLTALYGTRPAVWFSGTTVLPDFSLAAPIAREMWQREHGTDADGVISLDPVALSYLLKATGPITLPTGETLTSDNAVDLLLNQVYLRYPDPAEQNAVFAQAAAAVFQTLVSGSAEPSEVLSALRRAGDERRLLLWSEHEDEQRVLEETTLSGHRPVTDDDAARFGIYLNDGTGSKLGYYLDVDPQLTWDRCGADQVTSEATLKLTLTNTAPADAATSLPGAIIGGSYGVPAATLRVVTYIYLPVGANLLDSGLSGDLGFGGGRDGDYRVISFSTDLAPGDSTTASLTVSLPNANPEKIIADLTPAFGATSVVTTCAG
ncbi:DUF4012 domain-containing protein [Microbacterium alcoholitolerans]|uniref:DUF4012 domain-containing protein n=1 Tax=unclassified Microbacterium TaxID=2609290 RepID=UPI003D177F92